MQKLLFRYFCMKNVLVQFRRRYLILRPRNSKNMNVRDTPFLPFKINILQNPFLAHLFTPMRTYSQNFMSLTLIVRTSSFIYIISPFYSFVPLELRISKKAEIGFQVFVCSRTISKTISYFAVKKLSKNINFIPFIIKILQNPFLAHLYTLMWTYSQNFMSLTLIVFAGR